MSYEYNTNGLGVNAHYGTRAVDESKGSLNPGSGPVETAEWVFDYNNLPDASASNLDLAIPAYAKIVSAKIEVLTAFAGGTSLAVGLQDSAGTEIDDDGFLTAAQLATANIDARGDFVVGTGALVGVGIGAAAGELVVTAVGTFTAGKARVLVEFIKEA